MNAAVRLGDLLDAAVARLDRSGVPEPRAEAEFLLGHLLDLPRSGLWVHREDPVAPAPRERFEAWLGRRSRREPAQHITGVLEFHGLEFEVDARALVPRPETELLVDLALERVRAEGRVVELGTGSGCIAISVAVKRPDLAVAAVELSEEALGLARENAKRHGVLERIDLRRGDATRPPEAWQGADAVLANPPYVAEWEWRALEPEVRDHDPRLALVAGETGLEALEAWLPAARTLLAPGGFVAFEIGHTQGERGRELAARAGLGAVAVREDLAGLPRTLYGERVA